MGLQKDLVREKVSVPPGPGFVSSRLCRRGTLGTPILGEVSHDQ